MTEEKRTRILTWAKERGVIRPQELVAPGASPTYLHHLVADGHLQRVGRGLYTLADYEPTEFHTR